MPTDVITITGNYTLPLHIGAVLVECWGAGANGYPGTSLAGGFGGGGGAYSAATFTLAPGTYPVTVGGTGGETTSWNNGQVEAQGGDGDAGGTGTHNGGNGSPPTGTMGGGGGGSATTTANGADASGIAGGTGLGSGGGGGGDGASGANGIAPGGGGGGGGRNGSAGSGARGEIRITYTMPTDSQCVVTFTALGADGMPKDGVVFSYRAVDADAGTTIDGSAQTVTSSGTDAPNCQMAILRKATYRIRRGNGPEYFFTVPDLDAADLADLMNVALIGLDS